MSERLRVALPFSTPAPLRPSTSHLLTAQLERVQEGHRLVVNLWPVGVPASAVTHEAVRETVRECIRAIAEEIRVPPATPHADAHHATMADLVARSLRRALLSDEPPLGDSVQFAVRTIPALHPEAMSSRRVLLVESNEPERGLLELALRSAGFDVRAVGDDSEAVRACRQLRFDVAIVDVREERWAEARELGRACSGRLLLMTDGPVPAEADLTDARALVRPFTRGELVAAVGAMLQEDGEAT